MRDKCLECFGLPEDCECRGRCMTCDSYQPLMALQHRDGLCSACYNADVEGDRADYLYEQMRDRAYEDM